jgi:flagellar biosynthesis/type III secretory pathway protein FliH
MSKEQTAANIQEQTSIEKEKIPTMYTEEQVCTIYNEGHKEGHKEGYKTGYITAIKTIRTNINDYLNDLIVAANTLQPKGE